MILSAFGNGDVSSEDSEDYDLNRGKKRKPKSSRFRSRSTKRARAQGTPSGVTPKSKEPRIEVPESRFGAKFDGDGVMIKPSKEREEAIRRVRDDKEKRFIAEARPHRPSGGERGGGGDLDFENWQQQCGRNNRDGGRGSGRGRGRNMDRTGNDDKNSKNFTIKHLNSNSGATMGAAAARKSNSFGDSASTTNAAQGREKTNRPLAGNTVEQGGATHTAPDNNLENIVMNTLSVPERVSAKSANPNFAAMMAKHMARAEEVVYVFSGLDEQLPLSQTHWEMILVNIQDQALMLQIKGEPSPEYKFSKFSHMSDKGFLGVASPERSVLIIQAVARITISGVKFHGQELKTKHLVTIEIRNELATCRGGVATIVEAMIKRNSLKGETISAWIENGDTPGYKVFKFFADYVLHQELLLRRHGPLGVDKGWNIFLYVGAQHSKAHISQQPGVAAEAEVAELRAERVRKEAAIEVTRVLKVKADREAAEAVRATQAKADREAAVSKTTEAAVSKTTKAAVPKLKGVDGDDDNHVMESNDKETNINTTDNWTTEAPPPTSP
jgi:hypothetical protein